jgi:ribosomal protein S27AE
MTNCPGCGEMINEGAKVCPRCGRQMANYSTQFPCPRCGELLDYYERFCHRCGLSMVNGYSEEAPEEERHSSFRPILIILIVLGIVGVTCYLIFNTPLGSKVGVEDEHVTFVKNGSPISYPDITYDEAFSAFFSDTSWEYFVSDKGLDVVEFNGDCLYYDSEITVTIQFVLDMKNGTFEMEYVAFNDVPQSVLMSYALITKVFESY